MKVLLIAILFALLTFAPTLAQDAPMPTPTYSAEVLATQTALEAAIDDLLVVTPVFPIVEVTEAAPDSGIIINIDTQPDITPTPAPQPETTPDSDVRLNVWQIVIGVGTLLVTGMAAGGFGVLALLRGINHNPALIAAIEGLANSRPDRERMIANEVGKALKEAGEVIEEATDNVPAAGKTSTSVRVMPAGSTFVAIPAGPQAPSDAAAALIAAQTAARADVTTGSAGG